MHTELFTADGELSCLFARALRGHLGSGAIRVDVITGYCDFRVFTALGAHGSYWKSHSTAHALQNYFAELWSRTTPDSAPARTAPRQDQSLSPSRRHSPGARAQARLLHVCLARPEWIARLRTDGSPDLFDVPDYRAIAAHLLQGHQDAEAVVTTLNEDHAAVLARLREEVRAAQGLDWDTEYESALSQLRDDAQIRGYLAAIDPDHRRALLDTMSASARQRFIYRRSLRAQVIERDPVCSQWIPAVDNTET